MLEVDYLWQSSGSSGAMTPVYVQWPPAQSQISVSYSTLASTQSISIQTAMASTGPWMTEASTSISTGASTNVVFRITGPYRYMRPYLHATSTGTYNIRLIGVS